MALHTELPIHKVAYDLAGLAIDLVKNMPREIKSVIGSELRDECLKLIVLIFRANVAADKRPHLAQLIERKEIVELLLRLSRDKRYISTGQYAAAIALTASIGKQANGWKKHASPAA
jgi:hypothetical protein